MALFCLTVGSKYNKGSLFDGLNSHPCKKLMLTNIHPLVAAVLHRVEIGRSRAGSLEPGAHGERRCPFTVLGAANLALETKTDSEIHGHRGTLCGLHFCCAVSPQLEGKCWGENHLFSQIRWNHDLATIVLHRCAVTWRNINLSTQRHWQKNCLCEMTNRIVKLMNKWISF